MGVALGAGQVAINEIVYAELAPRYDTIDDLDLALRRLSLDILPVPRSALFSAGLAFVRYRRDGGTRTGVLPDFFIGAHASALGVPLLTRDAGRYRRYFPDVALITPD